MAIAILDNLYGPEFILKPYMGRFPLCSLAAISGLIKPLFLPLISAVGLVLMPILAGVKMKQGDVEGAKAYLQAWGVSFLGLTASVAFIALIGFTLPLLWTGACIATLCALSIICHVTKALQEPA